MSTWIRSLALALAVLLAGSCAALDILSGVARGASYLAAATDVAKSGADLYFAKHPHPDHQQDVKRAVQLTYAASAALAGAVATAKAADDGDLSQARLEAKVTYRALVTLLDELGIPQGISPAGGAEADGPEVEPFALPSADDMASRL